MIRATASYTVRLLLVFSLISVQPANAEMTRAAGEALADAMVRMMEAMGMLDIDPLASGLPVDPMWMTPGLSSMPGASRWMGLPSQMPLPYGGGMDGRFPGGPWAKAPSRVEGIWEGRDGELLIVQGDRYRIYPGNAPYVQGYLQLGSDRLTFHNPAERLARPFEFAETNGMLVLKDAGGQRYVYRRLMLDREHRGSTEDPQSPALGSAH